MAYGNYGNASQRIGARPSRSSRSGNSRMPRNARSSRSAEVLDRMSMRPIYGTAAPALQPEYESDVRVIRPDRQTQVQQQPSMLPTMVAMAAIIIIVVAVLSFARIVLTSSAVVTMIENETISSQITEARSTGISLEMEQSVLKNPSAIRAQAKQLNMVAPAGSTTITLKPDIVSIESGDTLSLSGTIKNVVQINQ